MSSQRFKSLTIILFIAGIFIISGLNNTFGNESIRIAVLDFEANDTSKYAAKAVSEFISTEMAKKNELTVIERTQIGAILNEQGFQQTGCTDQSCAVEMGKLLSAKKILLGTLTKTGTVFVITAKSVDVETGRIEFAESERCTKEEDLELASKILAVKLINKIAGTTYITPLRTYQQDEGRNRFAVGLHYRYGIIKNVSIPVLKYKSNLLEITSSKADIQNQSIIFSPSYEITNNFGIRMDFKGISSKFKSDTQYTYSSSSGYETYMTSMYDDIKLNKSYGIGINFQFIYPIEGFNLFLIPGLGIDKYSLITPLYLNYMYSYYQNITLNGNCSSTGYLEMNSDVYSFLVKLETGFSVYVSRFVDFYFSAGVDVHLFSKLINDVKVTNTNTWSSGTPPPEQMSMLQNASIEFEGNFPPEYYIQAGVVLRLF